MDPMDAGPAAEPSAAPPVVWNACGVHQEVPATFTCSRCGTFGCERCLDSLLPMPMCVACAARGVNAVPWERRETIGLWRGFWDTSREVCFSPKAFFARPSVETLTGGPFYGVVAYTVGNMLFMLQFALLYAVAGAAVGVGTGDQALGASLGIGLGVFGCLMVPLTAVQAPVLAMFGLAFAMAGAHLSLMLMKQARGSWEDTLRGVGYANAGHLWLAVPCVGFLIAPFAVIWLEARATSAAHQTTTLAGFAAVTVWRLLLVSGSIALYVMVIALFVGAAAGAAAGAAQ
ncbi:MAG: hypothetical protein IPG17_13825 [Sandaracinaceae bacterium]|jgi:hypothetical protein|nr:hypothetical protein [Sandaracinaceae bacterium]MBK7156645.1 hypothetical protein [Sandaracinaceae bacterium]MBK7778458.1 hypothetical protein [Sandaracinaceae bacterium]MBK8589304.1 hypothetical protein [Sandaracinaceae bacterium]MBP7685610.1 hypothetical protein [Deltaproteobacteria bacterium]